MAKRTYVIMGATGHVGHITALQLLKKGYSVKALGRNNDKLHQLEEEGAEIIFLKDFDQSSRLTETFQGADAVFSFIPPAYDQSDLIGYQNRVGEATKIAIEKSGVSYVVNLSSIGANLAQGTGPIRGLHTQEERLNTLENLNVIHLRPCFFQENFYNLVPLLKTQGLFGMPLKGELPIEMVATQDIGYKAAEFLEKLNFKGKSTFDFFGPRSYTLKEAAHILGKAIGKEDLEYIQFPYDQAEKGLISFGLKPANAHLMIEMYHAFNEGRIQYNAKISPEHRGKTTLEQFSKEFANAYQKYQDKSFAKKQS